MPEKKEIKKKSLSDELLKDDFFKPPVDDFLGGGGEPGGSASPFGEPEEILKPFGEEPAPPSPLGGGKGLGEAFGAEASDLSAPPPAPEVRVMTSGKRPTGRELSFGAGLGIGIAIGVALTAILGLGLAAMSIWPFSQPAPLPQAAAGAPPLGGAPPLPGAQTGQPPAAPGLPAAAVQPAPGAAAAPPTPAGGAAGAPLPAPTPPGAPAGSLPVPGAAPTPAPAPAAPPPAAQPAPAPPPPVATASLPPSSKFFLETGLLKEGVAKKVLGDLKKMKIKARPTGVERKTSKSEGASVFVEKDFPDEGAAKAGQLRLEILGKLTGTKIVPGPGGSKRILVGSFGDAAKAAEAKGKVDATGLFQGKVESSGGSKTEVFEHLRIGPYGSRSEAEAARSAVRRKGGGEAEIVEER